MSAPASGGYYPDGKAFVFLEFNNDGPRGGGPWMDGTDGSAAPITNMANTPIENIESDQPLLITRYGYIPDTAGAGKYRGGLGMIREYQVLADETMLQIRSDRSKYLPWGSQGGKPGSPTYSILNPETEPKMLPSKFLAWLKKGDVYRFIQAGGGGYGDPLERDPSAVLYDYRQGKVTADHADKEYGVIIDTEAKQVDSKSTAKRRDQIRQERGPLDLEPRAEMAPRH